MATTALRSAEVQQAWAEGYNVALYLAARRLTQANDETKAACLVEEIKKMMVAEGPSSDRIEAMLGITPSPQATASVPHE